MLINARDPRQWTYLRNLPQKKKKNPVLTNVGKRAAGGYYIPAGYVYLKNSEPLVPTQRTCRKRVGKKNPRQPVGKGRKKKQKKTLVLTLGSPLEKGGKKKKTSAGSAIENAEAGSAIDCKVRTVTSQTDI
jgi:hypothetical protein